MSIVDVRDSQSMMSLRYYDDVSLVWNGGDTGSESRPACMGLKPLGKKVSSFK